MICKVLLIALQGSLPCYHNLRFKIAVNQVSMSVAHCQSLKNLIAAAVVKIIEAWNDFLALVASRRSQSPAPPCPAFIVCYRRYEFAAHARSFACNPRPSIASAGLILGDRFLENDSMCIDSFRTNKWEL